MGTFGNIEDILASLGWLFGPPVALFLVLFFVSPYGKLHQKDHEKARKKMLGVLIQGKGFRRYRAVMEPFLDRVDAWLSPLERARGADLRTVAFSPRLLDLTAMVALCYPVFAIIAQWLAGRDLRFAGELGLESGTILERAILCLVLIVSLFLLSRADIDKRPLQSFFLLCAPFVLSLGALWIADLYGRTDQFFEMGIFVTIAVTLLGFARGMGDDPIAFRKSYGVFWLWIISCLGLALLPEILLAINMFDGTMLLVAYVAGILIAISSAMALCSFVLWLGRERPLIAPFCLVTLALGGVIIATVRDVIFAGQNELSVDYIILVLAAFPMLNALADFSSLGLTRYCLRRGLGGQARLFALIDICGGVLIFLALGFASIAYLSLINLAAGHDAVHLGSLFAQLDAETGTPGNYWWLFFLLFTTLLPTAAHACAAVFCFALYYPDWIKRPIVALLSAGNEEDYPTAWLGSALLCATITASVSLVYWALYALAALDGGALLAGIIGIFEGFARLIGAI